MALGKYELYIVTIKPGESKFARFPESREIGMGFNNLTQSGGLPSSGIILIIYFVETGYGLHNTGPAICDFNQTRTILFE